MVTKFNGHADQAKGGQADSGRHAPNLPISPFPQAELQPTGGNRRAITDRRNPGPPRNLHQLTNPGTKSLTFLDAQAFPEQSKLCVLNLTLHLNVISAPVAPAWLTQASLQRAVGGQDQESLTVCVQSACGVDPGNRKDLGKSAPAAVGLWGELAEDPIGLVQKDGRQGGSGWRGR